MLVALIPAVVVHFRLSVHHDCVEGVVVAPLVCLGLVASSVNGKGSEREAINT